MLKVELYGHAKRQLTLATTARHHGGNAMPTEVLIIPPSERDGRRTTIDSWRVQPIPTKREQLGFTRRFNKIESEAIKCGFLPSSMDDKWFICFEAGWLLFYRSWTGYCIFGLRLDITTAETRVTDSWVNRDVDQYRSVDLCHDRDVVQELINDLLLQRSAFIGDEET